MLCAICWSTFTWKYVKLPCIKTKKPFLRGPATHIYTWGTTKKVWEGVNPNLEWFLVGLTWYKDLSPWLEVWTFSLSILTSLGNLATRLDPSESRDWDFSTKYSWTFSIIRSEELWSNQLDAAWMFKRAVQTFGLFLLFTIASTWWLSWLLLHPYGSSPMFLSIRKLS